MKIYNHETRQAEGKERYLYIVKFSTLEELKEYLYYSEKEHNLIIFKNETELYKDEYFEYLNINFYLENVNYKYELEIITDRKDLRSFLKDYYSMIIEEIQKGVNK